MTEKTYSVWVGGGEVTHFYRTKEEAEAIAREFLDEGFDDVFIENVKERN